MSITSSLLLYFCSNRPYAQIFHIQNTFSLLSLSFSFPLSSSLFLQSSSLSLSSSSLFPLTFFFSSLIFPLSHQHLSLPNLLNSLLSLLSSSSIFFNTNMSSYDLSLLSCCRLSTAANAIVIMLSSSFHKI